MSQISLEDFVYVLKDGCVAEQGYRADLEDKRKDGNYKGVRGEFRKTIEIQGDNDAWNAPVEVEPKINPDTRDNTPGLLTARHTLALRPISGLGTWAFDIVSEFTSPLFPRDLRSLDHSHFPKIISFDANIDPQSRTQSRTFADFKAPISFNKTSKRFSVSSPRTSSSVMFTEKFPAFAEVLEGAQCFKSASGTDLSLAAWSGCLRLCPS